MLFMLLEIVIQIKKKTRYNQKVFVVKKNIQEFDRMRQDRKKCIIIQAFMI